MYIQTLQDKILEFQAHLRSQEVSRGLQRCSAEGERSSAGAEAPQSPPGGAGERPHRLGDAPSGRSSGVRSGEQTWEPLFCPERERLVTRLHTQVKPLTCGTMPPVSLQQIKRVVFEGGGAGEATV